MRIACGRFPVLINLPKPDKAWGTMLRGLTIDDLQCFSNAIELLYQCQDIELFPKHVVGVVVDLVRSNYVAYNEVNPIRNRVAGVLEPNTWDIQKLGPILMRYVHQ